jgi:hypothetical protein
LFCVKSWLITGMKFFSLGSLLLEHILRSRAATLR